MALFGVTKPTSPSDIIKVGEATASFSGFGDAVMLQVQVQLNRQLTPIVTLGKGIKWASQPPTGQLTADTMITSSGNPLAQAAADACTQISGSVNLGNAFCGGGGSGTITIEDGFVSSIGATVSAQQGYISSNIVVQFTSCSM